MTKITGQNAWLLVRQSVQVGERLNTWSVARGNLGSSFVVEEISEDGLKIRLDGIGTVRTLSSISFDRLGEVWDNYVARKVARHQLLKLSHNTSYALPLLKRVSNL